MKSPPKGVPPPETPETKAELKEDWTMGQRWAPIAFGLLPDDKAPKRPPELSDAEIILAFLP